MSEFPFSINGFIPSSAIKMFRIPRDERLPWVLPSCIFLPFPFDLPLISTHFVSVSLLTTPQPCATVFSRHHFTEETVKGQKQPINGQPLPRLFGLHRTPSLHGVCHWGPPSPCHPWLPSGFSQCPSSAFLDFHPPDPLM